MTNIPNKTKQEPVAWRITWLPGSPNSTGRPGITDSKELADARYLQGAFITPLYERLTAHNAEDGPMSRDCRHPSCETCEENYRALYATLLHPPALPDGIIGRLCDAWALASNDFQDAVRDDNPALAGTLDAIVRAATRP